MSTPDPRQAELDARLRRHFGDLDAGAGFEERVMQRVASLAAAAPRKDLRAQFERRRELLQRRLRREVWMNSITALGIGACAGALLWRYASAIQRFASNSAQTVDPNLVIGSTVALVAVAVWFLIRRSQSGR